MAYSIGNKSFIFLVLLLLFLPFGSAIIKYHNGPLLKGDLNLSVLWYGIIKPRQKSTFFNFIDSLEDNPKKIISFEPQVSKWWKMVESYQALADKDLNLVNTNENDDVPSINVKVVNEIDDRNCSLGETISTDSIPEFLSKIAAAEKDPNTTVTTATTVSIIFISKEVVFEDACTSRDKCFLHGAIGKSLYIVVKNPTLHCPEKCAWPFHGSETTKTAEFLIRSPNGDAGTDLAILHLAAAMASTVTNPYGKGFYDGDGEELVEIGGICRDNFGTGAFPGFSGRVHIDPQSGGAFNAHGLNNVKFLLPGLWNPQDSSCWTIM